ncbi:MAG: hypothetical protein ACMUIP_14615 [bacterium]
MIVSQAETNTIITFLGMSCATVAGMVGYYAAYYKKQPAMIKMNNTLFLAHRVFGNFATILYLVGLFAGITGLIGAVTIDKPPLELQSLSFNIHTWGSFIVIIIIAWKTYYSYFKKQLLYGKRKWLGVAAFCAWVFTWITAAISYYVRTIPPNLQHPAPAVLLSYDLFVIQLIMPFILGGSISLIILRKVGLHEKKERP